MLLNSIRESSSTVRHRELQYTLCFGVLQFLDNVNVDSHDLADACNKFTGRLHKEIVEECMGYKQLETLQVEISNDI